MSAYGIIILDQVGDQVNLYVNSMKRGYSILRYARMAIDKKAIQLQWPEVKLLELQPGQYFLYCIDEKGNTEGDVKINIDYSTQKEYLTDLLAIHGKADTKYTDILKKLQSDNYIEDLYRLYTENPETEKEELLDIFTQQYNARQEQLNLFVTPMFTFSNAEKYIISATDYISYDFHVYKLNAKYNQWIIQPALCQYNTDNFQLCGDSASLYKIVILKDGELIRQFYYYEFSAEAKENIIRDSIKAALEAKEQIHELFDDDEEIDNSKDEQYAVASMFQMDVTRPIFRPLKIVPGNNRMINCTIPDYDVIKESQRTVYLAALELSEAWSYQKIPHKIKITAPIMNCGGLEFLPNTDTEYLFYIIDDTGTQLCHPTLVSFDEEYPSDTYAETYLRIWHDRYLRKLYTVFQEYGKNQWNIVSSIADKYFISQIEYVPIRDYIIGQVVNLDVDKSSITRIIQLLLLCDLQYFMNIDQTFMQQQVYAEPYKMHVFPQSSSTYLIRIMRINKDQITYQTIRSGYGATEVQMYKDDYTIFQCVDPSSWKLSSIAFYNNTDTSTASYFYFPKLEVEVKHGLY